MSVLRWKGCLLFVTLLFFGLPGLAQQPDVNPTAGVLLPSPSATETNDATTLSTNPANLGFADSWSLVYVGSWVDNQKHLAGHGHGAFLSVPVGPFGFGVSTEFLLPPRYIRDWQGLDKRARFSLGMSFNPLRSIGLGAAYRTFWGYDFGAKLRTLDISLTVRPVNQLSVVFGFENINRPEVGYGAIYDGGVKIPRRSFETPRRFNAALSVRPMGTDRLMLGTELHYVYGDTQVFDVVNGDYVQKAHQRTDLGAMAQVMITKGLSLRTRFVAEGLKNEGVPNSYYMDFALLIDAARFPFGLTASPYFKLAPKSHDGFEGMSMAVRLSGDEPARIPLLLAPRIVVPMALDQRLDTYGMADLMARFERIELDKGVDHLLLKPEAGVLTITDAMEIRRQVRSLERAGISTVCYLTQVDAPGYLACSAASQIWLNPAGQVLLAGLRTKAVYFRDLFSKLGVKADIVRVGKYKSAPETFTETGPSKDAAVALNRYLDSVYGKLVSAVGFDRSFENRAQVRHTLESGPFVGREALAAGLVDKLVGTDQIEDALNDLGAGPALIDEHYGQRPMRHRTYLDAPQVAVLHVDGNLVDGESRNIPILGIHNSGAKTLVKQIRKLKENTRVRAVVLRIDSPGGSALAADIIWRELMALREVKPVIASLGTTAASGGYYIASAADMIYSESTTLTGSIGIYYGKADVSGLLSKLGIGVTTFKRGTHADMDSVARAYTDEERKKLAGQLRMLYNLFIQRVADGRGHGFTPDIVAERAEGRIWSGADGARQLLVDRIGGYQEAVDYARALAYVARGTPVFHYPKPRHSIWTLLAKKSGMSNSSSVLEGALSGISAAMLNTVKAVWPLVSSAGAGAQVRLPYAFIEDDEQF